MSAARGVSLRSVNGVIDDLRTHFRSALGADPVGAYRDWFRAQEELRERGDADTARALADDLWELLPTLPFGAAEERARFFHNAAVFYGSPGPAADLPRARTRVRRRARALRRGLPRAAGTRAAQHNFATALSNLGTAAGPLQESVALFEQALAWRTSEREIARGVTLHNLGIALRRLAELEPGRADEHLAASAAALREAIEIRQRHGLAEGCALSQRHLAETLERARSPKAIDFGA